MIGELFVSELLVNEFLQTFIPTFNFFFQIITFFGHPLPWIFISAWLFWLGREKKSFMLISIILFSSLISGALKFLIARPRPSGLIVLEKTPTLLSFPSGHSVLAASIYSFFENKVFPKEKIFLLVLVLLTAISRLYLGVHYISDVFFGLLIGYFLGKLILKLESKINKMELKIEKFNEHKTLFILFLISIILLLILPDTFALGFMIIGYYTGFIIYKNVKIKITNKRNCVFIGTIILLIISFFAYYTEGIISMIIFFFGGIFITFFWPYLISKKKKN